MEEQLPEKGSLGQSSVDLYANLDEIFQKAKTRDEFEYICSLLRIRGMEDAGWDPLGESHAAIFDYIALIEAPLRDITKVRLALLTYCHITEIDAVYDILANMLRSIKGDRCSMIPFVDYTKLTKQSANSPKQKIEALKAMEREVGFNSLGKIFDSFFDDEIRNAFYHSDYTIYANEFRCRKKFSTWKLPTSVPLADLMKKIQDCIDFYLTFMRLYDDHRKSYKEPKIIKGRFAADGGWLDLEILVQEGIGVTGFQSPPGSKGS